MATTWSDWLKSKRGRRGDPDFVSLDELARRVGVSRTRIIQIEALADAPPYPTRQRIHDALGTTDDDLYEAGVIVLSAHDGARRYMREHAAREAAQPAQPDPRAPSPLAQLIDAMWDRMDAIDRASLLNVMEGLAERQRLMEAYRAEEDRDAEDGFRAKP